MPSQTFIQILKSFLIDYIGTKCPARSNTVCNHLQPNGSYVYRRLKYYTGLAFCITIYSYLCTLFDQCINTGKRTNNYYLPKRH